MIGNDLAVEICREVRAAWMKLDPGAILMFGPELTAEPEAIAMRRRGGHLYWVSAPILDLPVWKVHVGAVLDPPSQSMNAGFHIDPSWPSAHLVLARVAGLLQDEGLHWRFSGLVYEEQWNRDPMPADVGRIEVLVREAGELRRRVMTELAHTPSGFK